jgi:hypothetical protein
MRSRWRGGKRTQPFGGCRPGGVRIGGVLSGERITRDLLGRGRPQWRGVSREASRRNRHCRMGTDQTVQTPGRKPQAPSVSLVDQNRAAELKVGADKAPEALS